MGFENPAALGLLFFLVLLLLARRRTTRVPVPVANLYLWRAAAATDAATFARRLRRHWLLMLQAACLAAVAIALARPVVSRQAPVALIVDTSLSMGAVQGGETRLDAAKREARALLTALPRRTRVRVIAAGPEPVALGEFDTIDAASTAIDRTRTTDAPSDLPAAIHYARTLDPQPRRLYVISDAAPSGPERASLADVEWTTVGRAADNAAITNVNARPAADDLDRLQIVVGIANYGDAVAGARLAVEQGGVAIGERTVRLPARSNTTYAFTSQNVGGVLTAHLEHGDALAADNVRRLVPPDPAPVRVHVAQRGSGFLEQALQVHPHTLIVGADEAAVDLVVCDGCSSLPPGTVSVLVLPPPAVAPLEAGRLVTIARDHPLAEGLELDGETAALRLRGDAPATATVVVQGSGLPAVIASEENGRRVVEVRIDPDNGTWPYSTAFPVLVANAVRWLSGRDAPPDALTAGEPLHWPMVIPQREAPVVFGPDGEPRASVFSQGILSLSDTRTAGVYRVRAAPSDRLIAVNPAALEESDLAVLRPVAVPGSALPQAPAARDYRPIGTLLVVAALALLAVEWGLRLRGAGLA